MASGLRGHVQEIRQLIHDLRPLSLDQLGLVGAIEQQVSQFGQRSGIKGSFTITGDVALNPFAEVTVFRVVQRVSHQRSEARKRNPGGRKVFGN